MADIWSRVRARKSHPGWQPPVARKFHIFGYFRVVSWPACHNNATHQLWTTAGRAPVSFRSSGRPILTTIPRQTPSRVNSNPVPSATSTAAPVSQNILQSNINQLYMATGVVVPQPLDRSNYPHPVFWEENEWLKWVEREKEKGIFKRTQGQGVNSSWMEDADGNRVDLARQR
jgi:hypothetical protein